MDNILSVHKELRAYPCVKMSSSEATSEICELINTTFSKKEPLNFGLHKKIAYDIAADKIFT